MKISYFVGQSIDGYMADVNGGVAWMEAPMNTKKMIDKNMELYNNFLSTVDVIIMGTTTYEQLVNELFTESWAYPDHLTYVATMSNKYSNTNNIKFINDINLFIKENNDKHIWVVGGQTLANYFIKNNLIDEYIITTVPVCLGGGLKLFDHIEIKNLHITEVFHNDDYITVTYKKKNRPIK